MVIVWPYIVYGFRLEVFPFPEQPSCIDLTEDHEEFVDLTNVSVNDSPVMVSNIINELN